MVLSQMPLLCDSGVLLGFSPSLCKHAANRLRTGRISQQSSDAEAIPQVRIYWEWARQHPLEGAAAVNIASIWSAWCGEGKGRLKQLIRCRYGCRSRPVNITQIPAADRADQCELLADDVAGREDVGSGQ
jgi:hypothetical protein